MDNVDEELLQPETNDDGEFLNKTQLARMNEAEAIAPNVWFAIASWSKSNDLLTPMERKAAFNFGCLRNKNRKLSSLKQALFALNIYNKSLELGFAE